MIVFNHSFRPDTDKGLSLNGQAVVGGLPPIVRRVSFGALLHIMLCKGASMLVDNDTVLSRHQGVTPTARQLNPGQIIFREGEVGDQAFLVKTGAVEIFMTRDGEHVVLDTLGEGSLFGEMSLIDHKPRMASARAQGVTTVLVISQALFDRKVGAVDPFVRGLLNILTDNARVMGERLAAVEATARTAPEARCNVNDGDTADIAS